MIAVSIGHRGYDPDGTANLFMMFAPLEGWRHVKVTDRHTAVDYARVLKDLADMRLVYEWQKVANNFWRFVREFKGQIEKVAESSQCPEADQNQESVEAVAKRARPTGRPRASARL